MALTTKILAGTLGSCVVVVGGYEVYTLSNDKKDLFGIHTSLKRKEIKRELKKFSKTDCTAEFQIQDNPKNETNVNQIPENEVEAVLKAVKEFNLSECKNPEVPPKTVVFQKSPNSDWTTNIILNVTKTRENIEQQIESIKNVCTVEFFEDGKDEHTLKDISNDELKGVFDSLKTVKRDICINSDPTKKHVIFKKKKDDRGGYSMSFIPVLDLSDKQKSLQDKLEELKDKCTVVFKTNRKNSNETKNIKVIEDKWIETIEQQIETLKSKECKDDSENPKKVIFTQDSTENNWTYSFPIG